MIYIVNLGDTMAPGGLWRDPPLLRNRRSHREGKTTS